MMFAQANSEHCRHKIFNASYSIDGDDMPHSLFGMIRNTHAEAPQLTLSAYKDNAAVIEGFAGRRFRSDRDTANTGRKRCSTARFASRWRRTTIRPRYRHFPAPAPALAARFATRARPVAAASRRPD